jgi:hypothetical protein
MNTAQPEFGLLVGLRAGSRVLDGNRRQAHTSMRVGATLIRIVTETAVFPNVFLTLHVSSNICKIGCAALPRNVVAQNQF